jgi:3-hydroxybutyryl-CoA dehydrogenase
MKVDKVRSVLVVGSGTMGQQIALQCATHGYEVIVYDVSPEALKTATAKINDYATRLLGQKRLASDAATAAVARIRFTNNEEEGARAHLLSESIPEAPDLKAKVFAQFNRICPRDKIFMTDTSTLVPSTYAEATGRPEQFAAFHFYQYVWDSNLVDIMPHPGTSPETIQLLRAFAKRIGLVPLVFKKEHPGYVVNAILGAINNTAINFVFKDDVASV